jgi:hypothetical protein
MMAGCHILIMDDQPSLLRGMYRVIILTKTGN